MALGLVLGGGGTVGIAWEIGVLAGLADALGWDPDSAAVIVGTSAGAVNGALLRQGRTLDELVGVQRSEGDRLAGVGSVAPADPEGMMEVFRRWASVERMDAATARTVAGLAATTSGVPEQRWVANFESLLRSGDWPAGDLRITGVSCRRGERVVWTAASSVPLVRAVAASCAVPGLFPPVAIGDDRYVDGGLWSGSNADVVAGEPLDAVVFVGPMGSGATGIGGLSSRMLEAEREVLAGRGVELRTVQPGERFHDAGMQLMDASRRVEALEIGLAEGKDAAAGLAPALAGS